MLAAASLLPGHTPPLLLQAGYQWHEVYVGGIGFEPAVTGYAAPANPDWSQKNEFFSTRSRKNEEWGTDLGILLDLVFTEHVLAVGEIFRMGALVLLDRQGLKNALDAAQLFGERRQHLLLNVLDRGVVEGQTHQVGKLLGGHLVVRHWAGGGVTRRTRVDVYYQDSWPERRDRPELDLASPFVPFVWRQRLALGLRSLTTQPFPLPPQLKGFDASLVPPRVIQKSKSCREVPRCLNPKVQKSTNGSTAW